MLVTTSGDHDYYCPTLLRFETPFKFLFICNISLLIVADHYGAPVSELPLRMDNTIFEPIGANKSM